MLVEKKIELKSKYLNLKTRQKSAYKINGNSKVGPSNFFEYNITNLRIASSFHAKDSPTANQHKESTTKILTSYKLYHI